MTPLLVYSGQSGVESPTRRRSPPIPPFGTAQAWRRFHPDEGREWWKLAMSRLIDMPAEKLAKCDIGELDLICAYGLPGARDYKFVYYLEKLDAWADVVRRETQ